ncbi:MAG: hypothetical protein OXFUSZZB_002313 [Candidatus Fervidibacter sp.]|jgi:uncharacterized DUF497 family protein
MRIDELVWDEENERHIARHGVSPEEVEEVCFGRRLVWRKGRRRYLVLGQTETGRYLAVFIDRLWGYCFRPVTARDMTVREKRLYRRRTGR